MARVGPRRGRLPRLRPCRRSPSGRLGWHKELMEPHRVRFSQHKCSPRFRNGLALTELVVRLASGFSPQAVPPMRLIWAGKHWVSLDNRRLACFRIFNIVVRLAGVPSVFAPALLASRADCVSQVEQSLPGQMDPHQPYPCPRGTDLV